MHKVGIIDYGSGNFTSVWNAVTLISPNVCVIKSKFDFEDCTHLILPGVGAYGAAMNKLQSLEILDQLKVEVFEKRKQFLGICVGMQILTELGEEFEQSKGLGFVEGKSVKMNIDKEKYLLPHMGWNSVFEKQNSPLFSGMDDDASFYFLHSFEVLLHSKNIAPVITEYGKRFIAAFSRDNIHGVQFHPEKSQHYGIKLLENFISF